GRMRSGPEGIQPMMPVASSTNCVETSKRVAAQPPASGHCPLRGRAVTDRRARYTRFAMVALWVCWICVSEATALQVRFDVVATDTVTGVNGLTVYTIRDNSAERCYTLFVVE